ncbi:hypothetical protein CDAR_7791 [Caerostris darwini]|uniref:Uncharacterized protein n=1 Tax=Caerostris darwini TaxID=1538125 RepID=A0AAV4Q8Y2_9ARAC|nr:hypothetical protein CDAR_7791 [Caerostris darwini]
MGGGKEKKIIKRVTKCFENRYFYSNCTTKKSPSVPIQKSYQHSQEIINKKSIGNRGSARVPQLGSKEMATEGRGRFFQRRKLEGLRGVFFFSRWGDSGTKIRTGEHQCKQ